MRRTSAVRAGVLALLLVPYIAFAAFQFSIPISTYLSSLNEPTVGSSQPVLPGKTLVVSHEDPAAYPTITSAVGAASAGDVILIRPGTYTEAVNVSKPWITIRGADRKGVVLDGKFRLGVGIRATEAPGISVQDLTVRNYVYDGVFFFKSDHWLMKGILAVNNENYGLFALSSRWGTMTSSRAMGGGDSGFYIGETHDCQCVIENSTAYGNAIGYSGTRVDGVTIRDSKFINNSVGVAPNTLLPEFPLVLTGQWNHPFYASNHTIENNIIQYNNNRTVQGSGIAASLGVPVGTGITLAGTSGITVKDNLIDGNGRWGIAEWYFLIPPTGNTFTSNRFSNNGKDIWSDGTSFFGCSENETATGDLPPPCSQWGPSRLTLPNPLKEIELILSLGRPSAQVGSIFFRLSVIGIMLGTMLGGLRPGASSPPKEITKRRFRVTAAVYDGLFVGVFFLALASSLVLAEGVSGVVDLVGAVFALTFLLTPLAYFLFVTIWFFYGFVLDLLGRRALGELMTDSRTVSRQGVVSFPRILVRNLGVYLDSILFGLVGLILVLAKKRTLGEILSGTYVTANKPRET